MSHYEILASCFHAVLSKLAMLHHCVMKLQGKGKGPTTRKEHCAPTLHVFEIVKILTRCYNPSIHGSESATQREARYTLDKYNKNKMQFCHRWKKNAS